MILPSDLFLKGVCTKDPKLIDKWCYLVRRRQKKTIPCNVLIILHFNYNAFIFDIGRYQMYKTDRILIN